MSSSSVNVQMQALRKNAIRNYDSIWKNTFFDFLLPYTPDGRGRLGEGMLVTLLRELTSFNVSWDQDKNILHENGDIYDMLVNEFRVEIKTATVGYNHKKKKVTHTYQHENIYEASLWDKLVFLDIEPNGYYLSIINHKDMPFHEKRHAIFETKATKHMSAWKFDTRKNTLNRGIAGDITIYIPIDAQGKISTESGRKLATFLNTHFSRPTSR